MFGARDGAEVGSVAGDVRALGAGSAAGPADRPAEFVALEEAARAALASAAAAGDWSAPVRAGVLAGLSRLRDLVALVEGRVLTAEREAGTWALHGDRDLASFAGRVSRGGRWAGAGAVNRATTLEAMPVVAGAMADGPVTETHLAEISKVASSSPAMAAELASEQGQDEVVRLAARFDGAAFGKELRRLAAAADPVSRQRSHDEQRAKRYLNLSHTPGGTVVKGLLDTVAGQRLALALRAHDPRPPADDEREDAQRRADALLAVVDSALTRREGVAGSVAPVQAVITVTEQTWAALRAPRASRGGEGSGGRQDEPGAVGGSASSGVGTMAGPRVPNPGSAADVVARLRGVPAVLDEQGAPWPASEIGRALCGCTLTRAVVGAAGQPLDLGRDVRLFTRAHWLALHAAGVRTCSVDGCEMPMRFTELHHMTWWERDGGETDMSNCAPECSFHHHEIHRLDLSVRRRADGTYEHRHPDGRLYGAACPAPIAAEPPDAPAPCDDSLFGLLTA